jgi:hypothetical protein
METQNNFVLGFAIGENKSSCKMGVDYIGWLLYTHYVGKHQKFDNILLVEYEETGIYVKCWLEYKEYLYLPKEQCDQM